MVRYVITNTGRKCQFWLIFRIKLIQYKILVYILGILPRCYNLRLGSGCNLGKDLSKKVEMSQLVKHKNTISITIYTY